MSLAGINESHNITSTEGSTASSITFTKPSGRQYHKVTIRCSEAYYYADYQGGNTATTRAKLDAGDAIGPLACEKLASVIIYSQAANFTAADAFAVWE